MEGAELMPAHVLYPILFISLGVIFCLKMQIFQNPPFSGKAVLQEYLTVKS